MTGPRCPMTELGQAAALGRRAGAGRGNASAVWGCVMAIHYHTFDIPGGYSHTHTSVDELDSYLAGVVSPATRKYIVLFAKAANGPYQIPTRDGMRAEVCDHPACPITDGTP